MNRFIKILTIVLNSKLAARAYRVADVGVKALLAVAGVALAGFIIYCGSVYSDPFESPGVTVPLMSVISGIVIAITSLTVSTKVGLSEVLGIEREPQHA